ncbi:MAG: hypothetical protein AAGU76_02345 [Sedimentibacter sp.]|uniref:hypothetical protein n=1 Tax=Sedimentibacter sp. TaxID=1960295 RepID=UPI0031584A32
MHKKIRLESRRNEVSEIQDNKRIFIAKKFSCQKDFQNEKRVLEILKGKGVKVPEILGERNRTLYLEHLGSTTLLNWYEKAEAENLSNCTMMISKLAQWLKSFYGAMLSSSGEQMILDDVNLRNFIIHDDEIYGIDFELCSKGRIERDAGRIAAYILTYEPPFTPWKVSFRNIAVKTLAKELNLDVLNILSEEDKEIRSMEIRRNVSFRCYRNIDVK